MLLLHNRPICRLALAVLLDGVRVDHAIELLAQPALDDERVRCAERVLDACDQTLQDDTDRFGAFDCIGLASVTAQLTQ